MDSLESKEVYRPFMETWYPFFAIILIAIGFYIILVLIEFIYTVHERSPNPENCKWLIVKIKAQMIGISLIASFCFGFAINFLIVSSDSYEYLFPSVLFDYNYKVVACEVIIVIIIASLLVAVMRCLWLGNYATLPPQDDRVPPVRFQNGDASPVPFQNRGEPPVPPQNGDEPPVLPQNQDELPAPPQNGDEPPALPQNRDEPPVPPQNRDEPPAPPQNRDDPPAPPQNRDEPPVPLQNGDEPPAPLQNVDEPPVPPQNGDEPVVPPQNGDEPPHQIGEAVEPQQIENLG